MRFDILSIPPFDRQLKRLAKRYPSLKKDFTSFLSDLAENPNQGVAIGKNCFKVRLAITSKGRGKSGGARVITNIVAMENTLYLIAIYDKSDQNTLTDKELEDLLKSLS